MSPAARRGAASPRLAILLMLAGALAVIVLLVQMTDIAPLQPAVTTQPAADGQSLEARRTIYVLAVTLVTVGLLTAFILGVYLVNRMGRQLKRPLRSERDRPHVDAWSQYRLSDEDIERATHEEDGGDEPPPNDEDDARGSPP